MADDSAADEPYDTITVTKTHGVATIVLDAGPVNLLTPTMLVDLLRAGRRLSQDKAINVVVIESANADFFIAHFDVATLLRHTGGPAERSSELNTFGAMCETYRTMPAVTIAKVAGRLGGGGSEFAMSCDMRFGALGKAVMNQMEVPLGILPGGGGTQRLTRLVGYARASELVLGGLDLDASMGEQWGYFNRSLPADELDDYVTMLASRIASFPSDAVRLAKKSLLAGVPDPVPGLLEESYLFGQLVGSADAKSAMAVFLEQGGQGPSVERNIQMVAGSLSSRRRLGDLIVAEAAAFQVTAARSDVRAAATRCEPWSGQELVAHVVATFTRFSKMLEQSRAGDFTQPFDRDELNNENMAAVAGVEGDPVTSLPDVVGAFCQLIDDPAEHMAHQRGPIAVSTQAAFGLSELILHHDDLLVAVGERYTPSQDALAPVIAAWSDVIGFTDLAGAADHWAALLAASGR